MLRPSGALLTPCRQAAQIHLHHVVLYHSLVGGCPRELGPRLDDRNCRHAGMQSCKHANRHQAFTKDLDNAVCRHGCGSWRLSHGCPRPAEDCLIHPIRQRKSVKKALLAMTAAAAAAGSGAAFAQTSSSGVTLYGRADDAIKYTGRFGGLTATGFYSTGRDATVTNGSEVPGESKVGRNYGAGVAYAVGGFSVGAAYDQFQGSSVALKDRSAKRAAI